MSLPTDTQIPQLLICLSAPTPEGIEWLDEVVDQPFPDLKTEFLVVRARLQIHVYSIQDPKEGRKILTDINTMVDYIEKNRTK